MNESNIKVKKKKNHKSHSVFGTAWFGAYRTQPLGGLCFGGLPWPSKVGSSRPPGSPGRRGATNLFSLPCVTHLHLDLTLGPKPEAPSSCEAAVPSTGDWKTCRSGWRSKKDIKGPYGLIWIWNLSYWAGQVYPPLWAQTWWGSLLFIFLIDQKISGMSGLSEPFLQTLKLVPPHSVLPEASSPNPGTQNPSLVLSESRASHLDPLTTLKSFDQSLSFRCWWPDASAKPLSKQGHWLRCLRDGDLSSGPHWAEPRLSTVSDQDPHQDPSAIRALVSVPLAAGPLSQPLSEPRPLIQISPVFTQISVAGPLPQILQQTPKKDLMA